MARTKAISLLTGDGQPTDLAELYGLVIENIQKGTLANALKSQDYTGDPTTGSAEFRRFKNAQSKEYGTARTAGKGDQIKSDIVTVNIDIHREIVEEFAKFDIDRLGPTALVQRRADSHVNSISAELDRAFFQAAVDEGTQATVTGDTIANKLENLIVTCEETRNEHIDGVDRSLMNLVLSPKAYSSMRMFLDQQSNPNVDTAGEEFGIYHGVNVYSSVRMPAGTDVLLIPDATIAQPLVMTQYNSPEKIPQSNDYSIALFCDYGVKVLAPEIVLAMAAE